MTAHELARKLLEMPDIEVRIWDGDPDEWSNILGIEHYPSNTLNDFRGLIDHEFIGISS